MKLGRGRLCLKVENIAASLTFYRTIGFETLEEHLDEGWAVVRQGDLTISLFQGHIERNIVTFRGADIETLAAELTGAGIPLTRPAVEHDDGSWSAEIKDPDGNVIFFNTYPAERE